MDEGSVAATASPIKTVFLKSKGGAAGSAIAGGKPVGQMASGGRGRGLGEMPKQVMSMGRPKRSARSPARSAIVGTGKAVKLIPLPGEGPKHYAPAANLKFAKSKTPTVHAQRPTTYKTYIPHVGYSGLVTYKTYNLESWREAHPLPRSDGPLPQTTYTFFAVKKQQSMPTTTYRFWNLEMASATPDVHSKAHDAVPRS